MERGTKVVLKNWRSIIAVLPLLFASAPSFAMPQFLLAPENVPTIMEINPVVLLNAAAPTQKTMGTSQGWTGNVALGFGLLTAISLFNSPFDVEVGAIYMKQISERDSSGSTTKQENHNVHIPLLFRYNFDERVGIGFGGYAGFASGGITTSQNGSSSLTTYNDAGVHNRDFGLLFSARASLMIVPQLYFIVDGRYQHGLSNLANIPPGLAGDVLNTRSMQAYLGLSYRFALF